MAAILSSLISGVLLFLSFPKFDLWPLAWVALTPFLAILPGVSSKQAFWYGWLTGTVYFLGCLYWVTYTMILYGNLPLPVSTLIMLLLVIYLGSYVGLFLYLYKVAIDELPLILQILVGSTLWVTLEWLRAHLLTGFPWALLGYSQYQVLPVIQIADLTGVYGVSFLLVTTNIALSFLFRTILFSRKPRDHFKRILSPLVASGVLVGLALIYGFFRLTTLSEQPISSSLRVGLIQGNIDQAQKWDPVYQRETLDIYKDLTLQAHLLQPGLDLVAWPETATPFIFEQERIYRDELMTFTQDLQTPLLFGSLAIGSKTLRLDAARPKLFNSVYLLSATGNSIARYDKIHLVPFGEYVPLSSLLFFVHKMVEGIGDFGTGQEYTVMESTGNRFGVVICFEVIFPDLVRKFVRQGAQFMATLTNDAWFGRSSAPYQHFSMVVFRAIENRVPFIRAANTGITGSIDATGRIQGTTDLFIKTYLVQEINLKEVRSFYTQYGDLFAYLCGIITLVMIISYLRRERSDARGI
jgi:apolipoprotein N-acyltransferase